MPEACLAYICLSPDCDSRRPTTDDPRLQGARIGMVRSPKANFPTGVGALAVETSVDHKTATGTTRFDIHRPAFFRCQVKSTHN
jgi:hypothetical protein